MRASRLKRKVGKAKPGPKYPSAHVLHKWSLGWADIPHRGPLGASFPVNAVTELRNGDYAPST